jgi:hypothetical protein
MREGNDGTPVPPQQQQLPGPQQQQQPGGATPPKVDLNNAAKDFAKKVLASVN